MSNITGVTPALIQKDYYHGLIPREELPDLITENGDFLLRVTEPGIGMAQSVVISVMLNKREPASKGLKHYVIRVNSNGHFHCERNTYKKIEDLVADYKKKGIPLDNEGVVIIKKPVPRADWELRNEDVVIEKKLGEGAYGEVCKGTYGKLKVAIKKNHMGNLNKAQIKEVMAEARTIRKLEHPNIVKFVGVGAIEEPLLIVMELASFGSLDSYMQENGPNVNPSVKSGMCAEVAKGILHLKSRKVLHRDLAARNCLLFENNVVKLSDFGKSQHGDRFDMDPTEKLPIRWLAPETMTNHYFTPATEVWSFGIICWEIFANGAEPYPNKTVREVNEDVVRGRYMAMPEGTPQEVRNLVEVKIWVHETCRTDIDHVVETLSRFDNHPASAREQSSSANTKKSHKHDKSSKKGRTDSKKHKKSKRGSGKSHSKK